MQAYPAFPGYRSFTSNIVTVYTAKGTQEETLTVLLKTGDLIDAFVMISHVVLQGYSVLCP